MSAAATTQIQTHSFKGFFEKHRTLDVYPTGGYRWSLLVLTIVANVLIYYDLGFSGILPLWMSSLHFTAKQFGYFLTCAVVLSGLAGLIGGPLADRHGRVVVIDTCLVAQLILTFANLLMKDIWSFVIIRGVMFVIAGLAAPALSGLARDLTPRLGRATGYGMLGLGSVASQWVWAFIPGVTLSRFPTWESQVWIMSFIGVVLLMPSMLWLKDIHPSLRLTVIESETSAADVRAEIKDSATHVPETAKAAFSALLSRWEIWVLVSGVSFLITVPITIQTFGPVMFVQAFKYTPAEASKMASYFYLSQTLSYLPSGYLSDVLRLRKTLSFVTAIVLAALVAWWSGTFSHPLTPLGLGTLCMALGATWSLSYVPWAGFYSEYLEDVSPANQATGWSCFHAMFRFWLAITGLLQPWVAQKYGWGTWVLIVALTVVLYILSLVAVPGYWGRAGAKIGVRQATVGA
jgi:MFS family permease